MPIADPRYFSREHIESVKFNAPAALAEQAIHCLELVSELASSGLAFQFKGGNSLLLILDEPRRFSIDVDIATDETRERIENCLVEIVRTFGAFSRWDKRQHKTKPWIPLASYYLFYKSHYVTDDKAFIMLDVQLKRSPYHTAFKAVSSGHLYSSNAQTDLPFPASIIGDKLLTLGPSTLGIPVGKGKEAQRLKHVYDISVLMDTMPVISEIRESFSQCLDHENSLQQKTLSIATVVSDTVEYCRTVKDFALPPVVTEALAPTLKENIVGLAPFADHLFSKGYDWPTLQLDMARVAYCIAAVGSTAVADARFSTDLVAGKGNASYFWHAVQNLGV
jgi:hypothetical protein